MQSDRVLRSLIAVVGAVLLALALPLPAQAQEAALSGTVSDSTGGALPGVTVRAVHTDSGNSFEAVTDERGDYRIALRVGAYQVTADLPGFAPVTRALTLLVGQQAVADLQLSVSGVQESVTVTGEAPLLNVQESGLGGNIDPRQLQELPVQGRNWMDLVMLAPGAQGNAVGGNPVADLPGAKPQGNFTINIDGQQVNHMILGTQPRLSRDTIGEFEFLSSRFDATQGRSTGVQVNAVTKAGTNRPGGTFSGYFRDDQFNAADHVAKTVLPYQDQQWVATFGGPIRKDKIHFFANYEYEREPNTLVWNTLFPHFNISVPSNHTEKLGGGRVDAQFSTQTRLLVRGTFWRQVPAVSGSNSVGPSPLTLLGPVAKSDQAFMTLTRVLGNRGVNELKGGYAYYARLYQARGQFDLKNPKARFDGINGPSVLLPGFTAGGTTRYPSGDKQTVFSVRDDLTYSFTKGGRHTVKTGAEYLHQSVEDRRCTRCEGELDANRAGLTLTNDLMKTAFPDLFDVTTWNLNAFSATSRFWTQAFAPSIAAYTSDLPRYTFGTWVQDDWNITSRLTLNLGVRYDLEMNAFANDVVLEPFWTGREKNDLNNVGPRVGFTFSVNDRTVLRGGGGLFVGSVGNNHYKSVGANTFTLSTPADGRADFASNPYNGPEPTWDQILARVCTPALLPGCLRRELSATSQQGTAVAPGFTMPYAYQASIGLQRQLGPTLGVEADYVYTGNRDQVRDMPINLTFDPATGANYPFSDISRRRYPQWGFVGLGFNGSRSNRHALQTAFTKRLSQRWQASGTYTLATLKDAYPPPLSGFDPVPFPTALDFMGEYSPSIGDQRHRAVLNGVWEMPYGFQLSGLYTFGSGERFETRWGTDVRNIGNSAATWHEQRLRPDGTMIPRNNLVGSPIHRADMRIQRRFPLGGRAGIDGIVEVYNVFNHANYGSYAYAENARNYGQPSQNNNLAYGPRMMQLGFRLAF